MVYINNNNNSELRSHRSEKINNNYKPTQPADIYYDDIIYVKK